MTWILRLQPQLDFSKSQHAPFMSIGCRKFSLEICGKVCLCRLRVLRPSSIVLPAPGMSLLRPGCRDAVTLVYFPQPLQVCCIISLSEVSSTVLCRSSSRNSVAGEAGQELLVFGGFDGEDMQSSLHKLSIGMPSPLKGKAGILLGNTHSLSQLCSCCYNTTHFFDACQHIISGDFKMTEVEEKDVLMDDDNIIGRPLARFGHAAAIMETPGRKAQVNLPDNLLFVQKHLITKEATNTILSAQAGWGFTCLGLPSF